MDLANFGSEGVGVRIWLLKRQNILQENPGKTRNCCRLLGAIMSECEIALRQRVISLVWLQSWAWWWFLSPLSRSTICVHSPETIFQTSGDQPCVCWIITASGLGCKASRKLSLMSTLPDSFTVPPTFSAGSFLIVSCWSAPALVTPKRPKRWYGGCNLLVLSLVSRLGRASSHLLGAPFL